VVGKRWGIAGVLIVLAAVAVLRIALTDQYIDCKNARAVTYIDDLVPTFDEQVTTVTSCEQQVISSNTQSSEKALGLAAAAALLCFLLYNFGSRPALHQDHSMRRSSNLDSPSRNLSPTSQNIDRGLLKMSATAPSLIGPTVALNGVLCSDGDFHIEGSINGGIQCVNLVIAESGRVYGDIVADRVLVCGQFKGELHANEVVLAPGCHVEGTIWQKSLRVENGARFNGQCRHSSAPLENIEKRPLVEPVLSLEDLPQKAVAMASG
jgi:cytoskeletal protein CcmA (bactofilin family)